MIYAIKFRKVYNNTMIKEYSEEETEQALKANCCVSSKREEAVVIAKALNEKMGGNQVLMAFAGCNTPVTV